MLAASPMSAVILILANRGNIERTHHFWGQSHTMEEMTNRTSAPTDARGIAPQRFASNRDEGEMRVMRLAMRISLAFGVLMLVGKTAACFMTGSAAILSDAAESVIHVVAVAINILWAGTWCGARRWDCSPTRIRKLVERSVARSIPRPSPRQSRK